jgi:hypothetical protein
MNNPEGTQWLTQRLLASELTVRLRTTILAFCCRGAVPKRASQAAIFQQPE